MARMKDFRMFIAEDFVKRGKGLIDLDRAFVAADELWDNAAKGDEEAKRNLGRLAKEYRKRELA